MLQLIAEKCSNLFVAPLHIERGYSEEELQQINKGIGISAVINKSVGEAFSEARAVSGEKDVILITGSHYLIEEVLKIRESS